MKFKIRTRHAGARFTIRYILKSSSPATVRSTIPKYVDSTNWEYARLVERKFEAGRAAGQKRLYLHKIVAFHPSDSHKSDNELLDIAEEALTIAMPEKRHFVMSIERNTAHPHVHVVVALRSLESKRVHRSFVDYKSIGARLEVKHSLYNLDRLKRNMQFSPAPGTKIIERNTGKILEKNKLKYKIDAALKSTKDFIGFLDALSKQDIQMTPYLNSNGLYGVCFLSGAETFKGSQVNFSAKDINKEFSSDSLFLPTLRLIEKVRPDADINYRHKVNKISYNLSGEKHATGVCESVKIKPN